MKFLQPLLAISALALCSCGDEPRDYNPKRIPGVHEGSSIGDGSKDPRNSTETTVPETANQR